MLNFVHTGAASVVDLSLWERSDRITDAIRVRGCALSWNARPLTRIASQFDLSPTGRGEGR
jgi:hypothetical protein